MSSDDPRDPVSGAWRTNSPESVPGSRVLALRDEAVELEACRKAIGDVEILCYEAWTLDNTLTKDAARRFLLIAEIFRWDMPWVAEMRGWIHS